MLGNQSSLYVSNKIYLVNNLNVPSVIPHGETQIVSATIRNGGNNTETDIIVDFLVNENIMVAEYGLEPGLVESVEFRLVARQGDDPSPGQLDRCLAHTLGEPVGCIKY